VYVRHANSPIVKGWRLELVICFVKRWKLNILLFLIGTTIDVFRGKAAVREQEDEKYPTQLSKTIKVCVWSFFSMFSSDDCHIGSSKVVWIQPNITFTTSHNYWFCDRFFHFPALYNVASFLLAFLARLTFIINRLPLCAFCCFYLSNNYR